MVQQKGKEAKQDGSFRQQLEERIKKTSEQELISQLAYLKRRLDPREKETYDLFSSLMDLTKPEEYVTIDEQTVGKAKAQISDIDRLLAKLDENIKRSSINCSKIMRLGAELSEKVNGWKRFVPELRANDTAADQNLKDINPIDYLRIIVSEIEKIAILAAAVKQAKKLEKPLGFLESLIHPPFVKIVSAKSAADVVVKQKALEQLELERSKLEYFESTNQIEQEVNRQLKRIGETANPDLALLKSALDEEYEQRQESEVISQKLHNWKQFVRVGEPDETFREYDQQKELLVQLRAKPKEESLSGELEEEVAPVPEKKSAPGSGSQAGLFSRSSSSAPNVSTTLSPQSSSLSLDQTPASPVFRSSDPIVPPSPMALTPKAL